MPSAPRVFVLQDVQGRNFTAALNWGELVFILPAKTGGFLNAAEVARAIAEGLADARPCDYLVLCGDPVAIAMAVLHWRAAVSAKAVNLLRFDRQERTYVHFVLGGKGAPLPIPSSM